MPETAQPGPSKDARESFAIPAGVDAPALARQVVDKFTAAFAADFQESARLLATELVTNSVLHGAAGPTHTIGLTVTLSPTRLRVEVTDAGPGFDLPEGLHMGGHDGAAGGFGLRLLDMLADRWGVERGDLTQVWFEFDAATRMH